MRSIHWSAVVIAALFGVATAAGQGSTVPWAGVGMAGGTSSAGGGGSSVTSSVGQPVTGNTTGGGTAVFGGFLANPEAGGVITAVEVESPVIPAAFELRQNYPNPFNPMTVIQFLIKNPEFLILRVYDLLGREVATLVNERREAGAYEVRFDAAGLASGVYVYRLTAGPLVQTRKMMVIR